MEDLKYKRNLGKFVSACNGVPELVPVKIKQEYISDENAVEEARLAEHFITMKQIERGHRLNNFQKEVKQRVKEKEVDKQRKLGKLVRKIARREERVLLQAAQSQHPQQLAARSTRRFPATKEDACLMASKTAPNVKNQRYLAKKQLLSRKEQEMDDVLPGARWWDVNKNSKDPKTTEAPQNLQISDITESCSSFSSACMSSEREIALTSHSSLDQQSVCLSEGDTSSSSLFPHSNCVKNDMLATSKWIPHSDKALKERLVQQLVVCRKAYAAVEREKVREVRQQEKFKEEAEILRLANERDNRETASSPESLTASQLAEEERKLIRWKVTVSEEEHKKRIQKEKELDRFIDGLREKIKQRMKARQLVPPPLCMCHHDMWSSGPDTCANNCLYYNNPKAYARALSSVLASMDVL